MDFLSIAKKAAFEAHNIGSTFKTDSGVLSSNYKDIKTLADLRMNDCIIEHLQSTNIPILSEEIEIDDDQLPDQCWIIDPLDGTYNFSRGYSSSAVSIGLWEKNAPILGVVMDIFSNAVYYSSEQNCRLNEQSISVSKVLRAEDAILATGFPSGASYATDDLMRFVKNVQVFKKVRALGSASLMLSYVASGVFDVYYEKDIYLWDVAAGLSLVKEAGGEIYYRRRSGKMKYEVLAANSALFPEVKSLLIK